MSGKNMDMTERISKIGETINQYRESVMAHFKDMDVEVKDWHVSVGKMEKEYDILWSTILFWEKCFICSTSVFRIPNSKNIKTSVA